MGETANNRTVILRCALTLFAAPGYDAVGVQEICVAAGVTKPTLYHYFGHKRGLLEALVHERCDPFVSRLAAATYVNHLPHTLQNVVCEYFRFATDEPVLYRMLLALWLTVPENDAFSVIAALNERQQHILEELFLHATRDHGNMRGRHRVYALTFLGTINTYIAASLNGYVQLDDALVQQAVKQFSHGIYS